MDAGVVASQDIVSLVAKHAPSRVHQFPEQQEGRDIKLFGFFFFSPHFERMASKIRRELKNVVFNYTDAEAMVREATSNDPWGPSTAIMSELADYTYNVQAYTLVMGMLWKRLNDNGKNWRHVYKALVLLEYLIKTGSHRVSQQCKDNLFSIQTLKDFQYIDKDGKDHGASVREKAKQIVALLKDDKLLQEERERAMHSREKVHDGPSSEGHDAHAPREGSAASGATATATPAGVKKAEEELQLQLALRMSKEQAEKDAALLKEEEESLKVAIALSQAEQQKSGGDVAEPPKSDNNNLLLDLDFSTPQAKDPWGGAGTTAPPPPSYDSLAPGTANDPWSLPAQPFTSNPWEPFDGSNGTSSTVNPFDSLAPSLTLTATSTAEGTKGGGKTRVEENFLGANAAGLVDLDSLLAPLPPPVTQPVSNPFGMPTQKTSNPFLTKAPSPSLVELAGGNKPAAYNTGSDLLPPTLIPILPPSQNLFGTSSQGSLFNTTPAGATQGNVFGSTPLVPSQGSLFGTSSATYPQGSLFGTNLQGSSNNVFGTAPMMSSQGTGFSTATMAPAQSSLFGVSPVQNSLFGNTPTQNTMFGSTPAQTQQPFTQNNALFNPFS